MGALRQPLTDFDQLWADPYARLCGAIDASRLCALPANPAANKAGGVEGTELLRAVGNV